MTKRFPRLIAGWLVFPFLAVFALPASSAVVEVNPYLSFADSPFNPASFGYFHLEDFEDGLFNEPGVTASGSSLCITGAGCFGGTINDSVDGPSTKSHWANGPTGISYTFDATVLGALPTSAGLVWTDGAGAITFEAYDASNVLIDALTLSGRADGSFFGTTGEDTFFGVTNAAGISRLFVRNSSGGIEVDHLQYGGQAAVVPVPAALWLFGTALVGLLGFGKQRKFI